MIFREAFMAVGYSRFQAGSGFFETIHFGGVARAAVWQNGRVVVRLRG